MQICAYIGERAKLSLILHTFNVLTLIILTFSPRQGRLPFCDPGLYKYTKNKDLNLLIRVNSHLLKSFRF